jgi:hypothetical protein
LRAEGNDGNQANMADSERTFRLVYNRSCFRDSLEEYRIPGIYPLDSVTRINESEKSVSFGIHSFQGEPSSNCSVYCTSNE